MKNTFRSDLAYCAYIVLGWRLILEAYAIFILQRFHLTDTTSQHWYALHIWQNFDGFHYASIAQKGYEFVQYAWFPLYPLAIKAVAWPVTLLVGEHVSVYVASGILVSAIGLVFALYYLLQLARQHFSEETGRNAIFLLLFFPTAVFLGAVYTESFFLMWAMGAFYFAFKRNWLWAGIFGFAAASTRLVGIALLPALMLQFYLTYPASWKPELRKAIPLLLIPGAILLYMAYQWATVGNPLQFVEVQQLWGREVNATSGVRVVQDIVSGLNPAKFGTQNIGLFMDAIAILLGLGLVGVLAFKKYYAYALYSLLVITIPLISGETTGMIRYLLVAFPMFLLLGSWSKNHTVYSILLPIFAMLFALLSINFFNNWWLA